MLVLIYHKFCYEFAAAALVFVEHACFSRGKPLEIPATGFSRPDAYRVV